jgi:hypothetical protein
MLKTGSIDLPLHPGRCPPWLFSRMKVLVGEIAAAVVEEYGTRELVVRLSSPMFFQALGCAAGFDWHSSGLTTTLGGALKEGVAADVGVAFCGGKGRASLRTPDEIEKRADEFYLSTAKTNELLKATRLSAKVDSACIQDGYALYHHLFVFDEDGNWAVVQQGLNDNAGYARRYHWFNSPAFVDSPNDVIAGQKHESVLNLTSERSREVRKISVDLVKDNPVHIKNELGGQRTLSAEGGSIRKMPARHHITKSDLTERDWKMLHAAYELQPNDYEELVSLQGVGGKTLRALALLAKIIYGKEADWNDPVKYSFAHGGKDGIPYPVDRKNYDNSIEFLRRIIEEKRIGDGKTKAILKALAAKV